MRHELHQDKVQRDIQSDHRRCKLYRSLGIAMRVKQRGKRLIQAVKDQANGVEDQRLGGHEGRPGVKGTVIKQDIHIV